MTRKMTILTEGAMIGRSAPRVQRPATAAQRTAAMVAQFRRCDAGAIDHGTAQTITGLALAAIATAFMAFLIVNAAAQLIGHMWAPIIAH